MTPRAAHGTGVTTRLWTLVAGVTLVAGGWWLRTPSVGYLAFTIAATVASLVLALLQRRGARGWAVASAVVLAAFAVLASTSQRDLTRIDGNWPAYRALIVERGGVDFRREIARSLIELQSRATRALEAPADPQKAFASFEDMTSGAPEQGIVLYDHNEPFAWGGRLVVPPDSARGPVGALHTPFYTVLYAVMTRGSRRAVATAVAYAEPPGDQIVPAIGNRIATDLGLHAFEITATAKDANVGAFVFFAGADTLLVAHAVAPGEEEARLNALVHVRISGTILLAVAFVLYLVASWRRRRSLVGRLVPLVVALALLALIPLNAFSSNGVFFDPTVYYAEVGGPFTASVGALGVAAAIVLLALLLALRRGLRLRRKWIAIPIVIAILVASPPLLRALGAGVAPPPSGVAVELWLGWEIALFLVAASIFIGLAAVGSAGLGARRGLPPALAPALATLTAAIAPIVLHAPGTWPTWYR
ncbi:MAG TPA: hypothetical protein VGO46_14960, partial [Gemmatimonadaceae bacterium]|nr:hypothetical protein [Gemmatimonadaceae bacterium]